MSNERHIERVTLRIEGERTPIEISFDRRAGTAYVGLRRGRVARTVERGTDALADLDRAGRLVGIELLDVHGPTSLASAAGSLLPRGRRPLLAQVERVLRLVA